MPNVEVRVLGSTQVAVDGAPVEVSAAKKRVLLAWLTLNANKRVSVASILEVLWGDAAPDGALTTMHGYIADLRRVLEPNRAPRSQPTVLLTVASGYCLQVPEAAIDVKRFDKMVRAASSELSRFLRPGFGVSLLTEDQRSCAEAGIEALDAALSEWAGVPFEDLADAPGVLAERDRLETQFLDAQLLRARSLLCLGKYGEALTALDRIALDNPWHELAWGWRAAALATCGRQVEALACLRTLRTSLCDELGIDPTQAIRDLETAIIRQEIATPTDPVSPVSVSVSARSSLPRALPRREDVPRNNERWPLVGREEELSDAELLVDVTMRSGQPHLLMLSGRRGVGKSRMLRELSRIAEASDFVVHRAQARKGTSSIPLWLWRSLTNKVVSIPAGGAEQHNGSYEGGYTAAGVVALADAVRHELVESARPTMLVVDDLQWVDDTSLEALDHLINDLDGAPVAIVLSLRPDLLDTATSKSGAMQRLLETAARSQAHHRGLRNLNSDETQALATAAAGVDLHPVVAAQIRKRSGGNPYLVVELARGARFDPHTIPPHVATVLSFELAALPNPVVKVLAAMSRTDQPWGVEDVADDQREPVDEVRRLMEAAVSAGVIESSADGAYRFVEDVTRVALQSFANVSHPRGIGDMEHSDTAGSDLRVEGTSSEAAPVAGSGTIRIVPRSHRASSVRTDPIALG